MVIKNLVIRADASIQIGTGHIMRCLALAQAWQEKGGQAIFVLANKSPALEARLGLEGMKVVYLLVEAGSSEDAKQTADFAHQFEAEWVVVDGYHFGSEYQKAIKNFGVSLLFVDDYGHAGHYYADLVLNQNISAHEDLYQSRETYTQLLIGTQYVLLRREFWQWRDWQREINPIARNLLVTLGGSDPDNVTLKVIQALSQVNVDDFEVIVIVGGSNPHYEELQAEVAASKLSISLQQNVNNMTELMAWADMAIAAGGSTNWELAFMGLPSLVITVAENQHAIAAELDAQGLIIHLGWHQQITLEQIRLAVQELIDKPNKREEMSKKGRELVDGNGANLVASQMINMLA
jgi:UDP-2,4-diacetamido-2,4,6-trideoxy-beta-L-altropyranose hydrolase